MVVFKEVDAFTFGTASDDFVWHGVDSVGSIESARNLGDIVAVNFLCVPAERLPFFRDRFGGKDIGSGTGRRIPL